jgi:hypothetical protein
MWIGSEIKKSYITIDSNVKLCYTYETGGGYFYGRLLGQVVSCCIGKLFNLPRDSGFTFSVAVQLNQGEVYEYGINQTRTPD